MKKTILNILTVCTLFFATALNAQVGVGVPSENIHPSAELEVKSTTKGFLPPRMTKAERDAIVTPAAGLLVWCNDCGAKGEIQVYNGTEWTNMIGGIPLGLLPSLESTSIASDITISTAISGGNVLNDFGNPITARGICWSTSPNPTLAKSFTTDGSGIGAFNSNLSGLTLNTTYYLRAYATNSAGTAYGNEISFTTLTSMMPTVTTWEVGKILTTTATTGCNISNDGNAPITARGVCWSTSPNPTIANSFNTDNVLGIGLLFSNLTGLTENTTYYLRAYGSNRLGTSYGNEISFTTDRINPVIGQPYQGGVLAYIYSEGQTGYVAGEVHGLIAAPNDLDESVWIRSNFIVPNAYGRQIGTGMQNTATISEHGSSAANNCMWYVFGGYNDWFLPSIDELAVLYQNRTAIGGFKSMSYWSSTNNQNYRINAPSFIDFSNGEARIMLLSDVFGIGITQKSEVNQVRAVRAF